MLNNVPCRPDQDGTIVHCVAARVVLAHMLLGEEDFGILADMRMSTLALYPGR